MSKVSRQNFNPFLNFQNLYTVILYSKNQMISTTCQIQECCGIAYFYIYAIYRENVILVWIQYHQNGTMDISHMHLHMMKMTFWIVLNLVFIWTIWSIFLFRKKSCRFLVPHQIKYKYCFL